MEAAPSSRPPVRVVRANTPEHQFGVFQLACAMHAETDFRHYTLDPQKCLSNLAGWMHHPKAVLLVAMRGYEVVGFAAGREMDTWFGPDSFFQEELLYTAPAERGSRAGYLLWRALWDWAEERGLNHKRAQVATGIGEGAERLYEHSGMYRVGGIFASH